MIEEEAKAFAEATGCTVKEDAGRGWRRVVASPVPQRIIEFDAVKDLMDANCIVVSTGGGVPVFEANDAYKGVAAVIDKDRSASILAAGFKADMLVILTAVEKVCVNFGKRPSFALLRRPPPWPCRCTAIFHVVRVGRDHRLLHGLQRVHRRGHRARELVREKDGLCHRHGVGHRLARQRHHEPDHLERHRHALARPRAALWYRSR